MLEEDQGYPFPTNGWTQLFQKLTINAMTNAVMPFF